jgi:holo-[acyl-carrier protein] synthase
VIIGVGIDILRIPRVSHLISRFPIRFRAKIFTEDEVEFCDSRSDYASSFAKMFALKEATIKAISDTDGIRWRDMEITHDSNGKPIVALNGGALRNVLKKAREFSVSASVSDEREYASAFVIIEGA